MTIVEELQNILYDRIKTLEMLVVLYLISDDDALVRTFKEKYVEAKMIDLNKVLESLREYDFEDIIRIYFWNIANRSKGALIPEILSKDVWIKVLHFLKSQGLKNFLLATDSVVTCGVAIRFFKEYCSGVIIESESPYSEICKEYLKKIKKPFYERGDLKNANTILIIFLKQNRKEISQKIKSIAKLTPLGSILGIVTSEKVFKSKGGLIYNLNLYDGTFLSIISVRKIIKDLIFIVIMKTPYFVEPFYIGNNYVAIFRSNVPTVFDPKEVVGISRIFGLSEYEVRDGLVTGRDRAFIVTLGEPISERRLIFVYTAKIDNRGFRNAGFVEKDTLYPVIRPTDIYWPLSFSEKFIVLPVKDKKLLSEEELKNTFPNTYEFFNRERHILTSRKVSYFTVSGSPFYTLDIHEEIFSPYKIVWKRASKEFIPSLVLQKFGKPPIPVSGVQYIPLDNIYEAYYLIALLSSKIYRDIISGYAFSGSITINAIRSLKIPRFNPKDRTHNKLSVLGKKLLVVDYKDKEKILKEINSAVKDFLIL